MKKKSSYQRLREENERLKEQIATIVNNPNGIESTIIKAHNKLFSDFGRPMGNGMLDTLSN